MPEIDYHYILEVAHRAAARAQEGMADEAACGFAWVTIDGRHPLAAYCRKAIKQRKPNQGTPNASSVEHHFGSKGYPTGWQFWKPGNFNGQAVHVHEAGADAFAKVLRDNNIECHVGSRLD